MSKKIVVIDDSKSIRELVGMTLENAGFQVDIAMDGQEALRFFDGRDVSLVITDLNMPNMDGVSLIKAVRGMETYGTVPILMLTTESQTAKKEEAKAAGATGWIVKPFVTEKLLAVVNRIIR